MNIGKKIIKKEKMKIKEDDYIIALAGNPNVGKSTVFNYLTGLKQHTGNWTGKTVDNTYGRYSYEGANYVLVDLPGTYSLTTQSKDEEAARNFVCFEKTDAVVVIADATALERNMNLVLQLMEITDKVVLCINLIDEAECKGISVDVKKLSKILKIPVIATNAKKGLGMESLKSAIKNTIRSKEKGITVTYGKVIEEAISILMPVIGQRWICLKIIENNEEFLRRIINEDLSIDKRKLAELSVKAKTFLEQNAYNSEKVIEKIIDTNYNFANEVVKKTVKLKSENTNARDIKIDRILTSKKLGFPVMIIFLALILWITIVGANYPSQFLSYVFGAIEVKLSNLLFDIHMPMWFVSITVYGIYRTLAWVISVMLPPMAIFFPLFTILEDAGFLPRIAFNLDNSFKCACAHGKQALTTCMGFGCNAVGVCGCNIINSPRERMIAILTNNFVPCNGRFSSIILLSAVLLSICGYNKNTAGLSVIIVFSVILLGLCITFLCAKILGSTLLKGMPSHFILELPPYRKPNIKSVIVHSFLDRVLCILGRAVVVAIPAGVVIWLMGNISIRGVSVLAHAANFFDPFAQFFGLDGYIFLAFVLGLPANEIVIPLIAMGYSSQAVLGELGGVASITAMFQANGWNVLTCINVILFMLMHFPCATTLLTIRKETKSIKWTIVAFMLPTICGLIACFLSTNIARFAAMFWQCL